MLSDIFPGEDESFPERISTSIRLRAEDYERAKFLAQLWNEGDAARGVRRRKWKPSTVMLHLIRAQLGALGEQMGGWPSSKEGAADIIRRAVAVLGSGGQK